MNGVYRTPLLTFWPIPLTAEDFKECFAVKKKAFKIKIKNGVKKLSLMTRFLSLF